MLFRRVKFLVYLALIVSVVFLFGVASAEERSQTLPLLGYRSGTYAASGSGFLSGMEDYFSLINVKDGGVDGVKLAWEEYLYDYDVAKGLEMYEKIKGNAIIIQPYSTPLATALLEPSEKAQVPLVTMGYGSSIAADGNVFAWVFPTSPTYYSQISAKIRFIASRLGGEEKLKGKKIAILHFDNSYGYEVIPILKVLSEKFGFELKNYAIKPPALDQTAAVLDAVKGFGADWIINRMYGVSCQVLLKEAAKYDFPKDHIVGVWWCGAEEDVQPVGDAAKGVIAANFHGVGKNFPVIQDILTRVYGAGLGKLEKERVGSVYYDRGVIAGIVTVEAYRAALKKFGFPVTGKAMKWALDNLAITDERLKEIGAQGLMPPLQNSVSNHEGANSVLFQQWDGEKWMAITDWVKPYEEIVRAQIKTAVDAYIAKKQEAKKQ